MTAVPQKKRRQIIAKGSQAQDPMLNNIERNKYLSTADERNISNTQKSDVHKEANISFVNVEPF